VPAPPPLPPPPAEQANAFEQGMELFQQGKLTQAILAFEAVVQVPL
jgi:hypothetical protein